MICERHGATPPTIVKVAAVEYPMCSECVPRHLWWSCWCDPCTAIRAEHAEDMEFYWSLTLVDSYQAGYEYGRSTGNILERSTRPTSPYIFHGSRAGALSVLRSHPPRMPREVYDHNMRVVEQAVALQRAGGSVDILTLWNTGIIEQEYERGSSIAS
jgi:hypothetical protein